MIIKHLNDVTTIARTAEQIGATLPDEISNALDHLAEITAARPARPEPGRMAKELAHHIGDRAAMDKALKAAATTLATTEAATKLHAHLAETCGSRIRGMMNTHAEQIAANFGKALTPHLDTLEQTAGRLPAWFTEAGAANLDPATYEAWTQARDAYTRIQAAQAALSPLYSGAIGQANADQFARGAANALRFAEPPEFATPRDAYAFRDALAGRTERVQGLAGQGSTFVDGLFVPTLLAHLGTRFVWATPSEVTARSVRVVDAMRELVASP